MTEEFLHRNTEMVIEIMTGIMDEVVGISVIVSRKKT